MSISVDDDFFTTVTRYCLLKGINRSMFIRESVKNAIRSNGISQGIHTEDNHHRAQRKDGKCNPWSNRGRCGVCYEEVV